ncbi:MAG: ABC transporter permease [Thermoleophilia bacterium]|nr:ABC transporter permease [Thermoleophilia bacterium]
MNAIRIARKDLLLYLQDRSALLELLILPVAFAFVLVGVFPLFFPEQEAGAATPLAVVNLDPGGALGERLLRDLEQNGGLRPELLDRAEAEALLLDGDIPRLLTIPAGFSDDVDAGRPVVLDLRTVSADAQGNEAVSVAVSGVARDLSLQYQIIASLQQMGEMQGAGAEPVFTVERSIAQAESQFASSAVRPLVAVAQQTPRSLTEGREQAIFGEVQIGVPGITVLFVFLTAAATARSIYDEKRTGSFRRLLAAPIGKVALLAGKMLPTLLICILQVVVIFAAGVFLFPLVGLDRLRLGEAPLALAVLVFVVALCATGLGILIAALARTEAQIGGLSATILWVMAFLGGSLVPLFLFDNALAQVGRYTPHGWANIAFYDVLVRGSDLAGIAQPLLALLAFTAAFFLFGLWRFDFE